MFFVKRDIKYVTSLFQEKSSHWEWDQMQFNFQFKILFTRFAIGRFSWTFTGWKRANWPVPRCNQILSIQRKKEKITAALQIVIQANTGTRNREEERFQK
jgi:hypothetical protein